MANQAISALLFRSPLRLRLCPVLHGSSFDAILITEGPQGNACVAR